MESTSGGEKDEGLRLARSPVCLDDGRVSPSRARQVSANRLARTAITAVYHKHEYLPSYTHCAPQINCIRPPRAFARYLAGGSILIYENCSSFHDDLGLVSFRLLAPHPSLSPPSFPRVSSRSPRISANQFARPRWQFRARTTTTTTMTIARR